MPYLANFQQSAKPPIASITFRLPQQAQRRPKTEKIQPDMVNWLDFSVALPESLGVNRIWQEESASIVRILETGKIQPDVANWPDLSVALPESLEMKRIWQEEGASVVRTLELEIRLLEQLYVFKGHSKVSHFLDKHQFLVQVLLEAYGKIGNYFGLYPQVFLEVVSDPEVQGLVELFGYVVTRLTPEEAGKQLRRFDQDWFLNQLPHVNGLLNFDVEFL